MDDLIAFFNAQIDKAERKARGMRTSRQDAPPHTVTYLLKGNGERKVAVHYDNSYYGQVMSEEQYYERFTAPAEPDQFVIADLAAKRAILDLYAEHADYDNPPDDAMEYATGRIVGLGEAVRLIASTWQDHPDYRAEWRP